MVKPKVIFLGSWSVVCACFFFVYLFILRETERVQVEEEQRERGRISSRICIVSAEPEVGLNLMKL